LEIIGVEPAQGETRGGEAVIFLDPEALEKRRAKAASPSSK